MATIVMNRIEQYDTAPYHRVICKKRYAFNFGFPSGIIRLNWNDTEKIGVDLCNL